MSDLIGAPEGIRTPGLCLRRADLYLRHTTILFATVFLSIEISSNMFILGRKRRAEIRYAFLPPASVVLP